MMTYKKIYFIGIKGVGMSGAAVIAKESGHEVQGSDVPEKFITDKILHEKEITIHEGFDAAHLDWQPDLVVIGTSWGDSNVEVAEARRRGLECLSYSQFLDVLIQGREGIAVAGVHGKTTTTALLAFLLTKLDTHPGYLVGTGNIPDLGFNAHNGSGKYFVIEADEYKRSFDDATPKFLDLAPRHSIVTSVELDHPDLYPNVAALQDVFTKFLNKLSLQSGVRLLGGDSDALYALIPQLSGDVFTYGFGEQNDYRITELEEGESAMHFSVIFRGEKLGEFSTLLAGKHNAANATACIAFLHQQGFALQKVSEILTEFRGTERRFDLRTVAGVRFLDDYAHHPTAVDTTLRAVRARFPQSKILCIFQPHLVSRTEALQEDFATCFGACDQLILVDIFKSARENISGITSQQLAEKVQRNRPAIYGGTLEESYKKALPLITPETIVVTMGAGDVYKIRDWYAADHDEVVS